MREDLGPSTVDVYPGDDAPQPGIESPTEGATFAVGQEITLSGGATDPEDGTLAGDKLSWEVVRHYNGSHEHPYRSATGAALGFPAPPPEDLAATGPGNYLEARLTATDSRGLKKTVTRNIEPRRVGVSFGTSPSGLGLTVNGAQITAPRPLTSWEGYDLSVSAPNQSAGGRSDAFAAWSDGGAQSHVVKTGTAPAAHTASFADATPNLARPAISRPSPAPGVSTRDRTPRISAIVRDSQTDLAKENVRLYVDGRKVTTFSYARISDRLSYTPKKPLAYGRHTVRVVANDGSLSSSRAWSFRIRS